MAAGFLATRAGAAVDVRSAGTAPADSINPVVVEAMREVGIDLLSTRASPKKLNDEMAQSSDFVITMGCGDACPFFPGIEYLDWPVPDPAGQSIETVRAIRDEIAGLVDAFIERLRAEQRIPS